MNEASNGFLLNRESNASDFEESDGFKEKEKPKKTITSEEEYGKLVPLLFEDDTRNEGYSKIEKLLNDGYSEAGVILGQRYAAVDREKSEHFYSVPAKENNAEALWGLACCLPHNHVPLKNNKEDENWVQAVLKSAQLGCPEAMNEAGNIENRRDNFYMSAYWYGLAELYEYPQATYGCKGIAKRWVEAGKPDIPEEFKDNLLYQQAAYMIRTDTDDRTDAFNNIIKVALNDGYSTLALFAAKLFEMQKNNDMAAKMYQIAAMEGDLYSVKAMADMLMTGTGCKQDIDKARRFYEQAAIRGEKTSCFVMGEFERNKGNIALANVWYAKALVRGLDYATQRIQKVQDEETNDKNIPEKKEEEHAIQKEKITESARLDLLNIDEYKEACQVVNDLNSKISFNTKRSFSAGYGNSRLNRLNSWIGNPKELGEEILDILDNDLTERYYYLLNEYDKTKSSDLLIEISDLFHDASNQLHKIQFGDTPLCQREFEMYISPQLYWALEAAKQGNVEGYVREQIYLKFRGIDAVDCPDELIKAIQTKFAYEGDSDMQYALYRRYDPSEEKYFNGPAINKEEKDADKTAFWLDKLAHNENLKISDKWVLDLLKDQKTEQVEKAMRKAVELEDPEYYYTIAEFFGTNTEIGLNHHIKNAYSDQLFASSSCVSVLELYKSKNDRNGFKAFLFDWIKNTPNHEKWFGGNNIYKYHYELFKWLNEPQFDAEYLDYIINHADEYWSKEAAKLKRQHLSTSIFGGKVTRKD